MTAGRSGRAPQQAIEEFQVRGLVRAAVQSVTSSTPGATVAASPRSSVSGAGGGDYEPWPAAARVRIGVRRPEALDLLDPLTAARHDLDRDRPGRRAHLANEP